MLKDCCYIVSLFYYISFKADPPKVTFYMSYYYFFLALILIYDDLYDLPPTIILSASFFYCF